ncbi:SDR family NAD(P)-dependent oxidoreductase [Mycobacterium sp. 1165178.9]|uniref:SDR family NAD(P)-dependent oxidoreductase n=1 Tax=Mycobacterium sp. 1165178.9 TaxID=1834070 RepID=UPI000800201D|nr:short-chain dehydrogenase [Mycobacterium sp. 1165178.9]
MNSKEIVIVVTISGSAVLITGGNRGIGSALVGEALLRGAGRVYVGTRKPLTDNSHPRVTALRLDITDATQIDQAVQSVDSLDLLINNAGLAVYDDLSNPAALEQHLSVNLFGTHAVIRAFLPLLAQSKGSIVNNLSVNALAPLSLIPAYSVSKAAAFSLTQSLRAILAAQGVRVHAVLTGPVDTDMTRGLDIPKASPQSVAKGIFDGVENGDDEIFPDPMSRSLTERWHDGAAKLLERQYAALLAPAESATS